LFNLGRKSPDQYFIKRRSTSKERYNPKIIHPVSGNLNGTCHLLIPTVASTPYVIDLETLL
jgi:hypothetical protein